MSTTCNYIDAAGQYLFSQNVRCPQQTTPTPAVTTPATPTTPGVLKTDCLLTDPIAVTGVFLCTTLVQLQLLQGLACNKIAFLTGRLIDGDIVARIFRWVQGDVAGEDLVGLTVVVSSDLAGKWVAIV